MENQQKQQVLEQIKGANNVLVAVSANPTVDELAASVGLTLALNKMNKRAITVFSGVVPSTIEFLQPEQIFETTTDSLRDFIIALDKSKADKLRYKVEDDVVRIFITPYRTTISDKDLEFTHGDFNVDAVVALGVTRREDLDKAITAHGRILHDATVLALTKREQVSELGAVNWQDQQASSLCEMVANLVYQAQAEVVDGQMATALLTGIIAETDRFKNDKTTPAALSLSSQLMSAGANQQLIVEKLDAPAPAPSPLRADQSGQSEDGALEIEHSDDEIDKIHIDEHGNLNAQDNLNPPATDLPGVVDQPQEPAQQAQTNHEQQPTPQGQPLATEQQSGESTNSQSAVASTEDQSPNENGKSDEGQELFDSLAQGTSGDEPGNQPTLKDPNTSNTILKHGKTVEPPEDPDRPQKSDKPFDLQAALSASGAQQTQSQSATEEQATPASSDQQAPASAPEPAPATQPAPSPPVDTNPPSPTPTPSDSKGGDSLAELEKSVDSPHAAKGSSVQDAQSAVEKATQSAESQPKPNSAETTLAPQPNLEPPKPLHTSGADESKTDQKQDKNAPPPVPPPMTPQFYDSEGNTENNNSNPFLNPSQ